MAEPRAVALLLQCAQALETNLEAAGVAVPPRSPKANDHPNKFDCRHHQPNTCNGQHSNSWQDISVQSLEFVAAQFARTKEAMGSAKVEFHHLLLVAVVDMFDSSHDGGTCIGGGGTNCCGMSAGVSGSRDVTCRPMSGLRHRAGIGMSESSVKGTGSGVSGCISK